MNEEPTNLTEPLPFPQLPMLIEHQVGVEVVTQRPTDGYINATELCQRAGKLFGHYRENAQTEAFLQALSTDIGIPISVLVQTIKGGDYRKYQGTWVHPQVAMNLAQWLSPEFAVKVSQWVFDWMTSRVRPDMPVHVKRS